MAETRTGRKETNDGSKDMGGGDVGDEAQGRTGKK